MMRSLKLQGRPWSFSDRIMRTWTEKGERLDAEMHSINPFSDASIGQVETLTHTSPNRTMNVRNTINWILRNLADANCGMLRGCAVFHPPRFLETTHLLCLILLLLLLSVL